VTAVGAERAAPESAVVGPEWWETLAVRWRRWSSSHGELLHLVARLRVAAVWVCIPLVVVMLVAIPAVRQGVRVWLPIYWLLILWFLLARTKTVSWRLVAAVFAAGVTWSLLIGLLAGWLVAGVDLPVHADGPRLAVAALTEESLKLLPLALLAALAPGRVRRFAAVDFLLVGFASGLAFQAFEEFFRRTYLAIARPGLLDLLLGISGTGPGSRVPQYGWGPLSGGWSTEYASFAGHHVTTALTAATAGLAIAAWRRGQGKSTPGRLAWSVGSLLAPLVMWWITVADHAGFNATGGLGREWVETARPAAPWLLRVTWDWTGEGAHRAGLLLVLLIVATLVDARRLRRADGTSADTALPAVGWSSMLWAPRQLSDRWTGVVTGWASRLPTGTRQVVTAPARLTVATLAAGCALGAYAGRDLAVLLVARSRQPGEGASSAALRSFAAAKMLREMRMEAMAAVAPHETRGSRRVARAVAVALMMALLFAGTWLAMKLATEIGATLTRPPDLDWLAGLLDDLADWWKSLSPAQQLLVGAGIAALIVLSGGSFGLAIGVSGAATFLATHGHGAASFVRDPRRATTDFLTHLTPQQVLGYALEIALGRLLPAGVGAIAGRGTRDLIDLYRRDPAAFRAALRTRAMDDTGSINWSELWRSPIERQRWVDDYLSDPANTFVRRHGDTDPAWLRYQQQHAGPREVRLRSIDENGNVVKIDADGLHVDPDNVVAADTKWVDNPARSSFQGDFSAGGQNVMMRVFDLEMRRYGVIAQDPTNPIGRIRIITNTQRAADYLGARARVILGDGVDLDVVVKPL